MEAIDAVLNLYHVRARARRSLEVPWPCLATAIEEVAEAVLVTDCQGTIQYVNPAFERLTGYSSMEAVGKTPRILKSGKQDQAFYHRLWDTINSGRVWSGRFVNKRKGGDLYEEEAVIFPVCNASGAIANYVAVQRDASGEAHLGIAAAPGAAA